MKTWLRRVLSDKRYSSMSRFKNRTLPDVRYRLGQSPFLLIGAVVKLMPANTQVTLKSGMNITKKLDYGPRDIYLNIDSDFEYRVRLHSCKKEPETVDWIETHMRSGDVLYDIGANTGAYSLIASKSFDGKVLVYAFEPAFVNFAQLCKNVLLNGCQQSVIPLQVALSDTTAVENFNYRSLVTGSAVHALGEAIDVQGRAFTPVTQQPVLGYRLDDLVEQFQLSAPSHVKIDVDGIEFLILKGMERTLTSRSVRSLMVEVNEGRGDSEDIIGFLSQKGFTLRSNYGANHFFSRGE